MGETGCKCSQCLVELCVAGGHKGLTRAGCDRCTALKDYTGIKLSKGLFHKHNGIKQMVPMEENDRLGKSYKQ